MPFLGTGPTKTPADGSVDTAQLVDAAVEDTKVADGAVVQVVNVQDATLATGTTVLPVDNTVPQNTEGDEVMTLAITPKSTTNKLQIEVVCQLSSSVINDLAAALFQDSTASALAAAATFQITATGRVQVALCYFMVAGTVSETTFKVRVGGPNAGTTSFNGALGAGLFNGVGYSSITITEIKAS